jgi:hypothetical protein
MPFRDKPRYEFNLNGLSTVMPSFLIKIHSIRFKLIASLIAVSLLIGLISLLVGGNLLYQSVLDEANNRVRGGFFPLPSPST